MISDRARALRLTLLALALLIPQGCADRLGDAQDQAGRAGFLYREIDAPPFRLTAFERLSRPAAPVNVYIEGDGAAWLSPTEVSPNPTPHNALGLRLALLDPAPNVLYLARPCQFTRNDTACGPAYWTNLRFSEDVVASMNDAITQLAGADKGQRIHLIGYSGGGAIAALISARRHDVASLRTIAGNLDPFALGRYHHVSPLTGSLNPIDDAAFIAAIPQEHFVGGKDKVVPAFVAASFVAAQKRAAPSSCAHVTLVENATHEEGWEEFWAFHVSQEPACP